MIQPNFLLIGAAKAGTTSLYYYLREHPQVFMSPVKEPRYFAPEYYTVYRNGILRGQIPEQPMELSEYQALFDGVSDEIAVGEASTEYMYFSEVPKRIKSVLPKVKIVAVLRNPAKRAFSAYCYHVRDGCEPLSFEEALQAEDERIEEGWQAGWHYKRGGFYYQQIKQYFELFKQNQIKIYLYEELSSNSLQICADLFNFLEIDADYQPNLNRKNQSYMPKARWLNYLHKRNNPVKTLLTTVLPKPVQDNIVSSVKKYNVSKKPEIPLPTYQMLQQYYRQDILMLEELIQKDLSAWLA